MAFINYPGQIYNLWGQDAPQYNPVQDILKATMGEAERIQQQQSDVLEWLKDADPEEFVSTRLQKEQADRIGQLQNYAADITKKRRGRLTFDDMLELQFQIGRLERWQTDKMAEQKQYFDGRKEFMSNPVAYSMEEYLAWEKAYLLDGKLPLAKFGVNAITPEMALNSIELFKPSTKVDYSDGQNGERIYKTTIYYGTGNEQEDLKARQDAWRGLYFSNPGVAKGIKQSFSGLSVAEQATWQAKAAQQNLLRKQSGDPSQNELPVTPEYMWSMSIHPQMIQRPTTKYDEQEPDPYLEKIRSDAAYRAKLLDNKNKGLTVIATGDDSVFNTDISLDGHMVPVSFKSDETYEVDKKNLTSKDLVLSPYMYLTSMTLNMIGGTNGWNQDIVGKPLYLATSKSGRKILENSTLPIKTFRVEKGLSVYSGNEEYESSGRIFKPENSNRRRRIKLYPGQPIPAQFEEAMRNTGEWDRLTEAGQLEHGIDMAKVTLSVGTKDSKPQEIIVYSPLTNYIRSIANIQPVGEDDPANEINPEHDPIGLFGEKYDPAGIL